MHSLKNYLETAAFLCTIKLKYLLPEKSTIFDLTTVFAMYILSSKGKLFQQASYLLKYYDCTS